jgi:hypothetical protein
MCRPVSERFDLPTKHSHIRHSQHKREKDSCMNASSETWQLGNQSVQVTHLEKVYWPQGSQALTEQQEPIAVRMGKPKATGRYVR